MIRSTRHDVGPAYAELLAGRLGTSFVPPHHRDDRRRAFERFVELGVPTRRVEGWKYTDVSGLADEAFVHAPAASISGDWSAQVPLYHEDDLTYVVVDGRVHWALSSVPDDAAVSVTELGRAIHDASRASVLTPVPLAQEGAFECLNRALWYDGLLVTVPGKQRAERRLHVVFVHTGSTPQQLVLPRLVVVLGGYAEARVAVTHVSLSAARGFSNAIVDVDVHEGARLEMCSTQRLSARSTHLCTTRIRQQRDSQVHHLDVALGGALARHTIDASLAGSGASVSLDGLTLAGGRQVIDAHTTIEHRVPHCRSRQLYKGILEDHATVVFNGRVAVHPGAFGTDGEQLNKNLLLSSEATVNSKPELEIENDDVRCTHGATVGQLAPHELFYLASRGIPPDVARDMLARGFLEDVLYRLDDGRRRADLHVLLDRAFARGNVEG